MKKLVKPLIVVLSCASVPAFAAVMDNSAASNSNKPGLSSENSVFGTYVVTGPAVNMPNSYDGSTLVVNSPSINEDYSLLQRSAAEQKALAARGYSASYPHVVLSGNIEATASRSNNYAGPYGSDLDLTAAELAAYVAVTPCVNAFMSFAYDNAPFAQAPNAAAGISSAADRIDNSRLFLDKGFITFGNLAKSPFYATVGQTYVPFGRYSYTTISAPLTRYLGKTKARAAIVGFHPTYASGFSPYAEAFAFRGVTTVDANTRIAQGGADAGIGYKKDKVSADAGVSFISTLADAQGALDNGMGTAQGVFGGFSVDNYLQLKHRVPGVDLHAHAGYGPVTVIAEYIFATRAYDPTNMLYLPSAKTSSFADDGAKPTAGSVEADYSFSAANHPMTFALSYSVTQEALAMNLPKSRYMAALQVGVAKDTVVTLGVQHDDAYGKGDTAGSFPNGSSTLSPGFNSAVLGQTNTSLAAQLDVYF